ncbi:MAG: hypothetical protein ABI629_01810 [bacterium]
MARSPALHRFLLLTLVLLAACGGGDSAQSFTSCGNHRLDSGERCDDGNLNDHDDCTSACQPARCGDGVVFAGNEPCDGPDLNGSSCGILTGKAGQLRCTADCQFDLSPCTTDFTPTPTAAPPTLTPTPTATPRTNSCGDGLLSADETCDSCPDDCLPQPCSASGTNAPVTVRLALPAQATRIDLTLAYRTDTVSLPAPLTARVQSLMGAPLRSTDTGHYRLSISAQASMILSGGLATVTFDQCSGAPAPEADDFACVVTTCRSGAADLSGCTCSVAP